MFQCGVKIGRGPDYAQHRVILIPKNQFRPVDIRAIIIALHRHAQAASSKQEFIAVYKPDIIHSQPPVAFNIVHYHKAQAHGRETATLVIGTKAIGIKIPFGYGFP